MEGKLDINFYLDVEITLKIRNIENFDLQKFELEKSDCTSNYNEKTFYKL